MQLDDCYQLGYVVKTHGLRGELQIFLDVDSPQEYQNLESVFVRQGQQLVPFFIESISFNGNKAIVAFDELQDYESAAALKGSELYLPLAALPELEDDQFYLHELAGFTLFDSEDNSLGIIENILETGPQLLLTVKHSEGKELLIPYDKSLLIRLDKKEKKIVLQIPEGLLDLYLNDED